MANDGVTMKSTLQMGDLWNKAMLAGMKNGDQQTIGFILGKIDGLSYRNNPNDETQAAVALTGYFEGKPIDESKPIIRAVSIFLPNDLQKVIVAQLQGDKKPPVGGNPARGRGAAVKIDGVVPIAIEVAVIRDEASSVGFRYGQRMHLEIGTADPLADMKDQFPKLAAPSPDGKALPAPKSDDTGKGKSKRKR